MRAAARGVRAAFVFLTRVPVGGHPYDRAEWAWAAAQFPLVGAVVGAFLGVLFHTLSPLGLLPDAVFVVAASLAVTGAMHEDGFADTCDALGGAADRARVFEILKDSRIGVFGACALLVSFVGRVTLLDRLGADASWALPLVGCAARVGPVWQMVALPYVSRVGAKSADVAQARSTQALVATGWFVLAGAIAVEEHVVTVGRLAVLAVVLAATTLATGWQYVRRAGGVTGDFLGATEQLCELLGYAVLAWASDGIDVRFSL
jgi:adenosylcobinamide-GDP ribazoletransferase